MFVFNIAHLLAGACLLLLATNAAAAAAALREELSAGKNVTDGLTPRSIITTTGLLHSIYLLITYSINALYLAFSLICPPKTIVTSIFGGYGWGIDSLGIGCSDGSVSASTANVQVDSAMFNHGEVELVVLEEFNHGATE
jgi:hypothetical protein